jgi:hypothetical protein
LLRAAQAFPAYVGFIARPPLLEKLLPWRPEFRRGISLIEDLPEGIALRSSNVGSLVLSDAIKRERDWASPCSDVITVWPKVYDKHRNELQWPGWKVVTREIDKPVRLPTTVYDITPPPYETGGVLPYLVQLEDASLYGAQQAVKHKQSLGVALQAIFEFELSREATAIRTTYRMLIV